MALTNWSISTETLFYAARYIVPIYAVLTVLSNIFNFIIIIVTVRNKHLHNVCNILIAIQAFGDASITWTVPVMVYNAYVKNLIPISTCYWIHVLPTTSMNFATLMILFIGIDRLFVVTYPTRYASVNKMRYLTGLLVICVCYSAANLTATYVTRSDDMVLCYLADAMTGRGKDFWGLTQVLINISVVVVYSKLRNGLKKRSGALTRTTRIFRSIYLIMVFYICGWVVTVSLIMTTRVFISDINLTQICEMAVGIFATVELIIPFCVYFHCAQVYRKAILNLFGRTPKIEVLACSVNLSSPNHLSGRDLI
ncbi:hypothetical protein QR680_016384 [Steinernema hermaphroditum]|uniref:G-protein coupled receptors family 1 profile domain-containing protein n=1 Tax=Steinernema hermaphroditum TaxID=289476 RepID=A0AA39LM95_9BILA|nr:hypothetical protein QR680_016384 [Steinernema hermaphroditum]